MTELRSARIALVCVCWIGCVDADEETALAPDPAAPARAPVTGEAPEPTNLRIPVPAADPSQRVELPLEEAYLGQHWSDVPHELVAGTGEPGASLAMRNL